MFLQQFCSLIRPRESYQASSLSPTSSFLRGVLGNPGPHTILLDSRKSSKAFCSVRTCFTLTLSNVEKIVHWKSCIRDRADSSSYILHRGLLPWRLADVTLWWTDGFSWRRQRAAVLILPLCDYTIIGIYKIYMVT